MTTRTRIRLVIWGVLLGLYGFLVVVSQDFTHFGLGDFAWYLNRADVLYEGILDAVFVYNITFPLAIGAVNFLLNDLFYAAVTVNAVAFVGIIVACYLIGAHLFSRDAGVLAAVLVACNASVVYLTQEAQTHALFMCVVLWTLLALLWFLHAPSLRKSALLGVMITVVVYARFEGVGLGLFVPFALFVLVRSQHRTLWQSVQLVLPAALISGLMFIYYMVIISQRTSARGSSVDGLFDLLWHVPPRLDMVSWRAYDLFSFTLDYWHPLLWLSVIAVLVLTPNAKRQFWGILALLGVCALAIFVTAPWASEAKNRITLAFPALLFGGALYYLGQLVRIRYASLVVVGVLGISQLLAYPFEMPFAFAPAQNMVRTNAVMLDAWVRESTTSTRIYSFCPEYAPYLQNRYRVLYRGGNVEADDPTQPTAPMNFLPKLYEENALWLWCDDTFTDWRAFFALSPDEQATQYGYALTPIYQEGVFTLYKVRQHD